MTATIIEFIQKNELHLCYLYDRWQDEAKYEDFDAYRDAIKKILPEGWTLTRAVSRPFEFEFSMPKGRGKVRVNRASIRHWTANR